MQIKVFTLPVWDSEPLEEEINKFLRSHRVLTIDRQFSAENGGYWTLFVCYQEGASANTQNPISRGGKIDYREILSPEEFGRFARYRDVRKEVAAQAGIPAYAVFTDDELSQIARMEEVSVEKIEAIKNVGKRAEKYGEAFVKASKQTEHETEG